jgi:hypothetical protein
VLQAAALPRELMVVILEPYSGAIDPQRHCLKSVDLGFFGFCFCFLLECLIGCWISHLFIVIDFAILPANQNDCSLFIYLEEIAFVKRFCKDIECKFTFA